MKYINTILAAYLFLFILFLFVKPVVSLIIIVIFALDSYFSYKKRKFNIIEHIKNIFKKN